MNSQEIRQKIEDEICKTQLEITQYRVSAKPVAPDAAIGRISRIDAMQNKSISDSLLSQAEEKLEKLKFVLSKIGQEDFAICVKCQNPIPLARILVRPESIHCVNCAK